MTQPGCAGGSASVGPTGPTRNTATNGAPPPWPAEDRHRAPRVRRTDGGGEVPPEAYVRLQSPEAVLRRVVRGVSTREYANVIDLTRDGDIRRRWCVAGLLRAEKPGSAGSSDIGPCQCSSRPPCRSHVFLTRSHCCSNSAGVR